MNLLAPMILKGAPINWRELAKVDPTCLSTQIVPRKYRSFFSHRNRASNRVVDLAETHDSMIDPTIIAEHRPPEVITSQALQVHHRYDLRSLQNNDISVPQELFES